MTSAGAAPRGQFITFEGGEGAGKSTQLLHLAERLKQHGVDAVATREPGGSPHAETLREVLLSGRAKPLGPLGEAVLFSAARIDHIDTLIAPALAHGSFVLCDRFADSTRAYQGALGHVDAQIIDVLEAIALRGLRPDLTLLLDLPPQEGLARAEKRRAAGAAPDRFEGEGAAFHEGLRKAFLDIAASEPNRYCVIDATLPESEVAAAIWELVEARFLSAPAKPHG